MLNMICNLNTYCLNKKAKENSRNFQYDIRWLIVYCLDEQTTTKK